MSLKASFNSAFARLKSITGAVSGWLVTGGSGGTFFTPADLSKLGSWSAAGFGVLTSVLTFFGIKAGVLDRLLRTDSSAALLVFCFVGMGLLTALIAGAVAPAVMIRFGLVTLTCLAMCLLAITIYPKFGDVASLGLIVSALFVVGFVVAVFTAFARISAVAGLLIIAVLATSLGLYGAVKLSVTSKRGAVGTQVTATFARGDSAGVDVHARAFGLDKTGLKVEVFGGIEATPGRQASELRLGSETLRASLTGDIDETITFPIRKSDWQYVAIRSSQVGAANPTATQGRAKPTSGTVKTDKAPPEEVRLQGELLPTRVKGILLWNAKSGRLVARVIGSGLSLSARSQVWLLRTDKPRRSLQVFATVTPSDAGDVRWRATVPGVGTGPARYQLRYRTCSLVYAPPSRTKYRANGEPTVMDRCSRAVRLAAIRRQP